MDSILGLDLIMLIKTVGLLGIFIIVFAESGLFMGFFLPGDSLLFTAGFLASQGYLDIALLMILSTIGAIAGDSFGYAFGMKLGPKIFKKEDSLLFSKNNLTHAKNFYDRHGKTTIILARFMPFIRTFAPILAGVGGMRYSSFFLYNVMGGILWATGLTGAGYFLGSVIPNVDRYIAPLVISIIIFSLLPPLYHFFKDPEERRKFIYFLLSLLQRKN